jgi:ethanolaminephosphotransferase
MPLLTRKDRENLHKYRYSGGDSSPVYEYVLSPLAQFCVDNFIPIWLAPNLVTLLGLAASVLSMVLTLVYNPDLSADGPSWLHLLNGLCVFTYQTFDNMDGKQARRSGSSSPLGMLFDHGCDAINAGVMCIPMASVIGSGWSPLMFMCIWNGFVPFYFQAWEEYYTGSMVLPPFNGPTEGLLLAVGMCFVSLAKGAHWWHEVGWESGN